MTKEPDEEQAELCEAAREAAARAYSPFSGLKVGAALKTAEGDLYTGVNIENLSYSLSICAERTALFNAVSAGAGQPVKIAVVAIGEDGREKEAPPCGACRQALFEFAPGVEVIYRSGGRWMVRSLKELLPEPFDNREGGHG